MDKIHLKTLGRYTIDFVFDEYRLHTNNIYKHPLYLEHGSITYKVKRNSDRYAVFSNNLRCFSCGLEGNYFLLQCITRQTSSAHFNLFADLNGEPLLFTKDHIIPKSLGGRDHIDNYNTMCYLCNMAKSNDIDCQGPLAILQARQKIKFKNDDPVWLEEVIRNIQSRG